MGELRQDITTKTWVIYSPERGKRPSNFRESSVKDRGLPLKDENCPFCPGNESMLLGIDSEHKAPDGKNWRIRVVPNKFPAVSEKSESWRGSEDMYPLAGAYGKHKVIIESPRHNMDIADMTRDETELLVRTYHNCNNDLLKDDNIMMVTIFRNHGVKAGTSLIHPHSQIIASPVIPFHIRIKEAEARRHFDDWGGCLYCDMINFEKRERKRVITENDSFVSFVPFAASVPFETWIMPKRHQSNFSFIEQREEKDLASILNFLLRTIREKLGDVDYNYVIHSFSRDRINHPDLHWYLQIQPRLTTKAGFEIGSGMSINPFLPEQNADFLKKNS